MKKMLRIAGIFLLLFVGNSSIAGAYEASQEVVAGGTVGFNLAAMFGDMEDPKSIWVICPDGVELRLTNTSMFVMANVQSSDAGVYRFFAQNESGKQEYRVALRVIVLDRAPVLALLNLPFGQKLECTKVSVFCIKA